MPAHCFCEALRPSLVRQPANTVSSLAFAVVVAFVIMRARKQPHDSRIAGLDGYAPVYAVALIIVGLGSAFYHASMTFIGQFLDVMGMYLIATFVVLYAVGRLRAMTAPAIVASYITANALLAVILFTVPRIRRYVFGAVLLTGLGAEIVARRRIASRVLNRRALLNAIILLTIGFASWILDITRTVCSPYSLLQGHALWHLAGAAASWQLFVYYSSERATD